MILLDPDLSSGPRHKAGAARRHAGSDTSRKVLPLPSAHTLARFLARAQALVRLRGQVSVLLAGDSTLRRLNRRFRGIDKPTDVLSFPADRSARGAEKMAGDLAIGVERARRQAAEQGHTLSTEIKVLILHGLLHLAGYDHETDSGRMVRRERALRARLGLAQGLIERADSGAGSRKRRDAGSRSAPIALAISAQGRPSTAVAATSARNGRKSTRSAP